ncbi:hypothetical protein E4U57_000564 [Claviceps arundinis]|uniref:Uncharacterized protein n=1 Tax=Claviceps arundinis TaxID=1623583 RepID=A0A9P7SNA6_9HYPO|nr:hypothetical protein E4U57_000564 [Claviceps arundinis]KAG5967548.1 hypothetical protein E4U56_000768 [Claviceps arundinis]
MAANSLVFIGTGGAVIGFPGEGLQVSQLDHTKETRATDKPADKLMDEPVPPPTHNVQRTNGDDGDNIDHRLISPKSVHKITQNGAASADAGSPCPGMRVAAEESAPFIAETHADRIRDTTVKTGDDAAKLAPEAASASHKNLDQSLPLNEVRGDSTASAIAAAAVVSIEQESTASNTIAAPQVEPVALVTSADSKSTSALEPAPATICETTSPKKPKPKPKPSTATKASRSMKANTVAAGKKRKLSNVDKHSTAKTMGEDRDSLKNAPPPEKKRKLNKTPAKSPAEDSAVTAPAKPTPSVSKVLKGKKERKPPVVGRTNRKTRSQGPVDL